MNVLAKKLKKEKYFDYVPQWPMGKTKILTRALFNDLKEDFQKIDFTDDKLIAMTVFYVLIPGHPFVSSLHNQTEYSSRYHTT